MRRGVTCGVDICLGAFKMDVRNILMGKGGMSNADAIVNCHI